MSQSGRVSLFFESYQLLYRTQVESNNIEDEHETLSKA